MPKRAIKKGFMMQAFPGDKTNLSWMEKFK
ncbi:MAG: hypothetical protein JWO95_1818, partial [Verrucomicrobiales bacterium]|nr:hypothetical protein [Verrucomicrobiales bacterium]